MKRKRIEHLIEQWVPILGLEHWTIKRHYVRAYRADDEACQADTVANWQYMHATMRFYMPLFKEMTAAEGEAVVVHELVHILLSCMESVCPDDTTNQRERSVEETALALVRARKGEHGN